nr:hypothetical protein [Helicobacter felis]
MYNFFESKDHKYTSGLFLGLMFVGSSWDINSRSLKTILNTCKHSSACKLQMDRVTSSCP